MNISKFLLNLSVNLRISTTSCLKMQTSITSFFKPRQPLNDSVSNTDDSQPEKVLPSGQVKRPTIDDRDESEIKRPAHENKSKKSTIEEEDKTKIEGETSKYKTSNDIDLLKSSGTTCTPVKTCTQDNDHSRLQSSSGISSPFGDVRSLIRKKINAGGHALHENIGISWFRALQSEFDKPYFKKLSAFLREQRENHTVYPPEHKVYSWTRSHEIKDTRVVILGQDPYFNPNQAHGYCFSVQSGVAKPPSLINIFKELEKDIPDFKTPETGDLTGWAKQGVLLLNTCLTVNQGKANSHQGKGWEIFTDSVISWLSKNTKHNLVFLLWGKPAQKKASMIDKRHLVLTAAHPSPLSAYNGFFDCRHFSKTNDFLKAQNLPAIEWQKL